MPSLRSRSRGVAQGDALLELGIGFRTREGVKRLMKEIAEEERKTLGGERKRQQKEEQDSAKRLERVREELIERRRRLAVASIGDELKRRKRAIEEAYREERRRIKLLLKERLDAGELTAKKYRQQLDNFDRDLRAVRDRQLQDAPRQTLRSRAEDVLSARFGDRGSLGGLLSGRAALFAGAGAAGALAAGKGLERAIALASSFEDQLVEVRKTTGLTGDDLDRLGDGLLDLATKTGIAQDELAGIAAVGGQLGIQGEANLLAFTETVAKFSQVTELSAEQAADALAKTGRAFNIPVEQLANLASAANELSNTTAARAGDVVDALQRVGAAGTNIGLTADQVAALAATLIDAGIESERAGTSLRNVFTLLLTEADQVAETAGVTEQAFREMISEDALGAIQLYLRKLNELDAQSRAIQIEAVFGQENVLQVQTLASSVEQLNRNLTTSREAFAEGESLNREFESSLDALSAQWNIFTARVTKAATEVGQTLVPALTDGLRALNRVAGGADDAGAAFQRARDQIGALAPYRQAIQTYEELSAKVNRTAAEEEELKRVTALLAEEYPQFITATNAAGQAMGLYTQGIREAIDAVRQLRAEEALRAAEQLGEGYSAARRRLDAVREQERLLDENARRRARGQSTGIYGDRYVGQARESAARNRAEAEAELRRANEGIVDAMRQVAGDTRALADLTRKLAEAGVDGGTLQGLSLRALSAPTSTAPAPTTPTTPFVPTGGADTTSDAEDDTEKEEERKRERQRDAFEALQNQLAEITAERIADETEREIAAIEVKLAAEIQRLEELKAASLKGNALSQEERLAVEARTSQAILDLRTTAEREIADVREDAREKEQKEERQRAAARLQAEGRIAQESLRGIDLVARAAAESIEDEESRRLALIEAEYSNRVEQIAAAFDTELRLLLETEDAGDARRARIQELRLKRSNDLREAELKRVADVLKAEEEADEKAQRRMEERRRTAQRYAEDLFGVIADAFESSLLGSDSLAQAQIDLEIAGFLEAERALEESLRRRQIDQETYQNRMDELSLRRQEFDRQVEQERAGFLRRSYVGLRDLFIATMKEELVAYGARKATELVLHTTTEEGKTVATLSGTLKRGAALAVEAGQALLNAAANMVSAVASQIASVVKSIPFPLNLALIPVGVAAVTGAYLGAKSLFFESGGFVGRPGERGPDTVPIVVGRGEAVLNHHQQAVVEQSLRRDRGHGLKELFASVRTPHSQGAAPDRLALPRFERGGFALPSAASVQEAREGSSIDLSPVVDELRAQRAEMQELGRRLDRQLGEIERMKAAAPEVRIYPDQSAAIRDAAAVHDAGRQSSARPARAVIKPRS